MVTQAQAKATAKYQAKTYDKVIFRLRKDGEWNADSIREAADAVGESMNTYIMKAIEERMKKEGRL